jgi:hypothetical protein
MAYYANADTKPKVGFRPYGLTNPQRAANLSGIGAARHDLNRPFDPWVLHQDNLAGLGQNHPFDQNPGGWVLHGLGAVSDSEKQNAITAGIDPGVLSTIDALGASDTDVEMLIHGAIDLPTLMLHLTGGPPSAGVPASQLEMEPTDWPSYGVEQALAELDSDLRQLESMVASNPVVASAVGSQVQAERAQYNSWLNTYHSWVNAANNPEVITLPDGTVAIVNVDQAGVNPIIIVSVGAVVALAAAIVLFHHQTVAATIAQAKTAQAQSAQAMVNAASTVAAQGDSATAQKILNVAAMTAPGAASDWSSWLQTNWQWLALAGVGIAVAGPIARGIFNRK